MNHPTRLLFVGVFALFSIARAEAQAPVLQIESFKVEQAPLPGAQKLWSKLICTLNNKGSWADGISFNYTVLVETDGHPESRKILTGGVTYNNVPAGKSLAMIYLSPNATTRFGSPIAATVQLDRGDRTLQTYQWVGKSAPPPDWQSKYPTLNGTLLNVRSTPWVSIDSELTPDLLVN